MTTSPSRRTRVRRLPDRAAYDRDTIYAIVDDALLAHVGFIDADGGFPVVQPMVHARVGDTLYLHGSSGSRQMRSLAKGADVCVTITIADGLVLARSGFHHSMNYRCVVAFGQPRPVADRAEIDRALDALVEHVSPGRAPLLRPPSTKEYAATALMALPLDEASAKVRTGGSHDDPDDISWPVWAGVVPLSLRAGRPLPEADAPSGVAPPSVRF